MRMNENPGFQLPEETFDDVEGHLRAPALPSDEADHEDDVDDVEGHRRHDVIEGNGLNADR